MENYKEPQFFKEININENDDADDPDDADDTDDTDDNDDNDIDNNSYDDKHADDADDDDDDADDADDVADDVDDEDDDDEDRVGYGIDINKDKDDDEDDDDNDDLYLQKFDSEIRQEYIVNNHPESLSHNYQEIKELCKIVRQNNVIIDEFHKTLPILTKYERTRVLGQRAKQINSGIKPLINVSENILDGYIIAEMELKEKKIPFIIRRPLPNGGLEYWKLEDLEIL
jgi:DNA-directed RNA polymerase subunit K/omega